MSTSGTNGEHRATIREIASAAGVSIATVSRVLNERPGVAEETRGAVLRVVRDRGFTANRSARALWSPAPPTAAARAGESSRAAEWYAGNAPPSPLSAALAGLPWDTLPPITLAAPARGNFSVLTARLGRRGEPAAAIAGRTDGGTRTLVVLPTPGPPLMIDT